MRFKINAGILQPALDYICASVELGKKGALPNHSHVLLRVDKKKNLYMAVTDVDVTATITIKVDEVAEAGETTVPAQDLLNICTVCKQSDLEFLREDKPNAWAYVKEIDRSGDNQLPSLDAKKFPGIPEPISGGKRIPAQIVRLLIKHTLFALAGERDEVKSNLQVNVSKTGIQAVGTDGGRFSVVESDISLAGKAATLHIPKRAAIALHKIAESASDDPDANITLAIDGNLIYFAYNELRLFCRQPTIDFPAWQRVLDEVDRGWVMQAVGQDFNDAVLRADTLKHKVLVLSADGPVLTIKEKNDRGERQSRVTVETSDPSIKEEVALSPHFVTNFLSSAALLDKGFSFEIVISSSRGAVVFRCQNEQVRMTYLMAARKDV